MKTHIALFVYALGSVVLGLLLCSFTVWKLRSRVGTMAVALLFFGGPVAAYIYHGYTAQRDLQQFHEDIAFVKELCAKYGGDRIYKTVDNVEGVFQIKATNPDPDHQWADQYGMVEPWALALGAEPGSGWLGVRGKGYWFMEKQPGFGVPSGPPYRRITLSLTANKADPGDLAAIVSNDGFWLKQQEISASALRSRYGYSTEDLTTPELRRRWIGGGKLKIVDLQTSEVLAERTVYYRATGASVRMAWSAGVSCPSGPPFLANGGLRAFTMAVLAPPRALPTEQQLSRLKEK